MAAAVVLGMGIGKVREGLPLLDLAPNDHYAREFYVQSDTCVVWWCVRGGWGVWWCVVCVVGGVCGGACGVCVVCVVCGVCMVWCAVWVRCVRRVRRVRGGWCMTASAIRGAAVCGVTLRAVRG